MFFFFKQKTAYEMRISDWSSDVCSSDLLYHAWASSASRKVRFCLAEKGLAYEGHALDLRKFEHHTPEYRKLNPSGVVPALLHDGAPIIESTIINEYLDDVFSEPSLRPADARERAGMRPWSHLFVEGRQRGGKGR